MIPLYDNLPTRRFPVMTVAIIALNVLVFIYELSLPSERALSRFFFQAGFVPFELTHLVDIRPRDIVPPPLTIFTAMFIHGGWLHIGFNMLFLWIFGNNVEDAMGRLRFLVFYFVCGVIAAIAQTASAPGSTVPEIGASGAIAGVLGAYIVLFPRARVLALLPLLFFFPIVYVPAWLMIGLWFLLQLASGTLSLGAPASGGVAYFAHIGGFLAGVVLVPLFARRRRRAPPLVF